MYGKKQNQLIDQIIKVITYIDARMDKGGGVLELAHNTSQELTVHNSS